MALYDRRTLDGVYSVRQSVIYIQNYRYAEERMMRMMAGWIALTPELAVKLEMAKQVYDDALHTDALGKRLPELRAQPQVSKSPNDAFVTFMNAIEDKEEWEDTIERLVGIYRVLKPHLISHYSSHVSAMNPVYEPPTLRILERLVEEEKRHVERGNVLLEELLDSGEKHRRASEWQAHLEGLLGASGGVTGFESEAPEPRRKVGRS
jgi:1,2-phenylacetyl-CoA epoxidase catalytic subunit